MQDYTILEVEKKQIFLMFKTKVAKVFCKKVTMMQKQRRSLVKSIPNALGRTNQEFL